MIINWHLIPTEIHYVTMDKNGTWCGHFEKPVLNGYEWEYDFCDEHFTIFEENEVIGITEDYTQYFCRPFGAYYNPITPTH